METFETYSESWPKTVTRAEALHELKKHGISVEEFDEDLGVHETYESADVLGWLGY